MRLLLLWALGPVSRDTSELGKIRAKTLGPREEKVADNSNLCLFQGLENS